MYIKVQTVEIGVDNRHTLALCYIQPCPIYTSLHTHTSNVSFYSVVLQAIGPDLV